jgi:hypothetical protein
MAKLVRSRVRKGSKEELRRGHPVLRGVLRARDRDHAFLQSLAELAGNRGVPDADVSSEWQRVLR